MLHTKLGGLSLDKMFAAAVMVLLAAAGTAADAACMCAQDGNFTVYPKTPNDIWSTQPTVCGNQFYPEGRHLNLQYEVDGLLGHSQQIRRAALHLEALSGAPSTVHLKVQIASAFSAADCNNLTATPFAFSPTVATVAVSGGAMYVVGDLADLAQTYFQTLVDTERVIYACPSVLLFRLTVYDPVNNATSQATPLAIAEPTGSNLALHVEYDCHAGESMESSSSGSAVSAGFMAVLFGGVAFLF